MVVGSVGTDVLDSFDNDFGAISYSDAELKGSEEGTEFVCGG